MFTGINWPCVDPVQNGNGEHGVDGAHQRREASEEAKSGAVDKHQEASLVDESVQEVSGWN